MKNIDESVDTESDTESLVDNQDDYEKYLTHLPYENLFGLSIDRIVEWSIGDVIVFDCSQLHASNNFSGSHTEKMSLTYFSSKEIQDELG